MLILLSPAKKLANATNPAPHDATQPRLLDQAERLVAELKNYAPQDLARLMHLSDDLAQLNAQRYAAWHTPFTPDNAHKALALFQGDVYAGLQAEELDVASWDYAQQHLRILSGLYGVLRPKDLIQAYRLEMGTKMPNERGKDLYAFWGERITAQLNTDSAAVGDGQVVNLASQEYFKAVDTQQLQGELITPVFKDWKNGQYKIISFYAKRARGLMARYLIEQQVQDEADLLAFSAEGYAYNTALTQQTTAPVFTRRND